MPERIHHPDLPGKIIAAYGLLRSKKRDLNTDIRENLSGKKFLRKMSSHFLDERSIDIHTQKYEKPKAFIKGKEISVSFSHTKDAIAAAVSREWVVGCDMEITGRPVHPRLAERMKHPGEEESLYELEHIRVWTFKEAALKCIGTGLRKPMKSVKIKQSGDFLFDVVFDDGNTAKICSFQHQEHWISICYHNEPIS